MIISICDLPKKEIAIISEIGCASHSNAIPHIITHAPNLILTKPMLEILKRRRGCLSCFDDECAVNVAADQKCWKSMDEHDAAIEQAAREKTLDEVRDACVAAMSGRCDSISGVSLSYILSDIRNSINGQPKEENK